MFDIGFSELLLVFIIGLVVPVSYTHLDVYKRQVLNSVLHSSSVRLRINALPMPVIASGMRWPGRERISSPR